MYFVLAVFIIVVALSLNVIYQIEAITDPDIATANWDKNFRLLANNQLTNNFFQTRENFALARDACVSADVKLQLQLSNT